MRSSLWMVTCVLGTGLLTSCLERPGATVGPEIGFGQQVSIGGGGVGAVDVLFVIDDSGSMREEQANLAVQIPSLVRDLASPPDRDGDGRPDWSPAASLRIAIATSDVGTGSVQIPGSGCMPGGDDGQLHGGLFEWSAGEDADAFASAVGASVEALGIRGCAFEQPLEAAARALARARTQGFPRADALLALIVVTDEEDCSVADDGAFFSSAESTTYNVHCTRNTDRLTPIAALVEQIRAGRGDDRIVFAAIAGVPVDVAAGASAESILAHPRMQYREITTARGLEPDPACELVRPDGTSLGQAAPARRLVELGAMLPGSVLTTICTDDFGPAIGEIAARIGSRIHGVCLARELPASAGSVPCEAVARLPEGHACASMPGYTLRELGDDGRELCVIAQVAPGSGESGWFYDPSRDGCPQLVLSDDAQPPLGSEVGAECFFPVLRELGAQCARASQCESGFCERESQSCAPLPEVPGDDPGPTG